MVLGEAISHSQIVNSLSILVGDPYSPSFSSVRGTRIQPTCICNVYMCMCTCTYKIHYMLFIYIYYHVGLLNLTIRDPKIL